MKVTGIIAEYNPFHNGHLYQIEEARRQTNADYIIVAMSGNFMQRGTPALIDKYTRAEMALRCGADLILELPALWSSASAEYFASAGVALLEKTGIVNALSFGAECDDSMRLMRIAKLLAAEPAGYKTLLKQALSLGLSYPAARKSALLDYLADDTDVSHYEALLDTPNNILAVEYLKALFTRDSTITPYPILRRGSGYHDETLTSFASASAIRHHLLSAKQSSASQTAISELLAGSMPPAALTLLDDYQSKYPLPDIDDFSSMLYYKLRTMPAAAFDIYADCGRQLSNRISHLLGSYTCYSDFCELLKTRELTHTRITRALLHILLEQTKEDYIDAKDADYIPYLRVLGFRRQSACLLRSIKENSALPLITKMADAETLLYHTSPHPQIADRMLAQDILAADFYTSVAAAQTKSPIKNEYTRGLVLVD